PNAKGRQARGPPRHARRGERGRNQRRDRRAYGMAGLYRPSLMAGDDERKEVLMLEVTAYTGLGPGPHDVNVTGLSIKTAKAGGDYLRWEFTDATGKTASANTSKEMTPGNKTG